MHMSWWEQRSAYPKVKVTGCRMKCVSERGGRAGQGEASWRPSVCPLLRRGLAAIPGSWGVPAGHRQGPPPTHTSEECHARSDTAQPVFNVTHIKADWGSVLLNPSHLPGQGFEVVCKCVILFLCTSPWGQKEEKFEIQLKFVWYFKMENHSFQDHRMNLHLVFSYFS